MKHITLISIIFLMLSCEEAITEPEQEVIADFSWQIDDVNFLSVHFNNTSKNAIQFLWDFGNGDTSRVENPNYTYQNGGLYNVTLRAYGANNAHDSIILSIIIPEIPVSPLFQLSGNKSKKWKLYREGVSASLGPDSNQPDKWWSGLYNDGSRSCLYRHEFTFYADKTFEFKDYDGFWGDLQVWPPEDPVFESCFEPSTNSMMVNDTDLSLWLSGTHSYDFDITNGIVILRGKGAWMGFPFLGTISNHGTNLPDSVAFSVNFEQMPSFDLMTINFDHGDDGFWTFRYVNYDNWEEEPPLVE